MLRDLQRPEYLTEDGKLVGRPFVSALFNGWRYVAVGTRIGKIPPQTTFHEFLDSFLTDEVLGRDWFEGESAKMAAEQHPISRWRGELRALRARTPQELPGAIRQVNHTGSSLAFLTLAYDVYSIYHCAVLPVALLKRLRHPIEFQGAKYEVAVAGIFARAGFTIEWIHDRVRKRPEFIATHKTTGERVVVEAKSRHRTGALVGGQQLNAVKANLDRLLRSALVKETDGLPYAIYLDANLPLVQTTASSPPWMGDVQRMLDRRSAGPDAPDPFVGVTVTNFSWHYAGEAATDSRSESLLVLPKHPRVSLRDQRTMRLLFAAVQQYGDVPGTFPES